ncbi:LacI family DNA-binding transcriptional regulator [Streptomyces sp. NPDC050842]|uniref:LacI family DNA-binding transcriptional regulator n=1 Tax=Streptomyces sp. NPDC050842 TaxID=3365636 RepID=UPI0037B3FA71
MTDTARTAGNAGINAGNTTGINAGNTTGINVGIKDVAREAGVSVGTVSNVINQPDRVSPATLQHVRRVIARLGYVRSESARQLRAGRSRIMALLVLDMGNPFFVDIARGAERTARAAGLVVMVCNSDQNPGDEADYLSLFAEQRVRGVLVTPADPSGANLREFRRHGIPSVLVDRVAGEGEGADAGCSVSVDDVAGGALAIRHLAAAGHRSFAYVSGPPHLQQIRDRREGALLALAEAGLPASALRELPAERLDVASGRDAGARLLGLTERPTAVFCANDLLALGVLQSLYAAGVRVPEDMAIVGYDDIEFAAAATVPLTSVRQPALTLGAKAAELLLEETGERADEHRHEHVVLQPELVVRRSTLAGR